jgi:hypothetical protein
MALLAVLAVDVAAIVVLSHRGGRVSDLA